MQILALRKRQVGILYPSLWKLLDANTHPDLGRLSKKFADMKPALVSGAEQGQAVVFHVGGKKKRLFYSDEITPEVVELTEKQAKMLMESVGPQAFRMTTAAGGKPPKIIPHERGCG